MTPFEVYSNLIGKLDALIDSYDKKCICGERHKALTDLVVSVDDQLHRLSMQQMRDIKVYTHKYLRRKDSLVVSEELTMAGFDVAWHKGLSKLSETSRRHMLYGTGEEE